MSVGVGEKRRMEMRARLENTETENKAKESENAWKSLGETPFAGAEQEKGAEKSIEEKRAETEAFSASVREKLATQLGGEDPWKSGLSLKNSAKITAKTRKTGATNQLPKCRQYKISCFLKRFMPGCQTEARPKNA